MCDCNQLVKHLPVCVEWLRAVVAARGPEGCPAPQGNGTKKRPGGRRPEAQDSDFTLRSSKVSASSPEQHQVKLQGLYYPALTQADAQPHTTSNTLFKFKTEA